MLVCVCACVSTIISPWGRQGQLGPWWPVGTGAVRFVQEQWRGCCCAVRSDGGTDGHRVGWGSGGSGSAPPEDGAAPPVVGGSVMKGHGVRQATGQGGLWRI